MSHQVYVTSLPKCDIHGTHDAKYDAKMPSGPWAYMCAEMFRDLGCKTGTGYGQELVVGEEPERTDDDIKSDLMAAIEAGDFDAAEEALGDRDIAEFM